MFICATLSTAKQYKQLVLITVKKLFAVRFNYLKNEVIVVLSLLGFIQMIVLLIIKNKFLVYGFNKSLMFLIWKLWIKNSFSFFLTGQVKCWGWCNGVGLIMLTTIVIYVLLLHYFYIKPNLEKMLFEKCQWNLFVKKVLGYVEDHVWARIGIYFAILVAGKHL